MASESKIDGKGDVRVAFIQERLQKGFPALKADRFSKAFGDPDTS
jgi:hypothetical protein